jgi:hypothetical protein
MAKEHGNGGNIVQRRPAETSSPVAMALAMLLASWLGADETVIVPLAIVIAFLPAAVTFVVELVRNR